MEAWRDELWQGDTPQAHSAHEAAEQHTERNRRGANHQLQQLEPNDFINQRGTTTAGEQQEKQWQKPLRCGKARGFSVVLYTHSGLGAPEEGIWLRGPPS